MIDTVEPHTDNLVTMKITLLYQVSCFIRVKQTKNLKELKELDYLIIRGFC